MQNLCIQNSNNVDLGCGKSVLASFLAETAETAITLPYYFEKSRSRQSTLPTFLAVSLLCKLCGRDSVTQNKRFLAILAALESLRASHDESCRVPLQKLLNVLDALFALLQAFTLIIDGLDECAESEDSSLLFKYLVELGSRPSSRVILLSRHQGHLREILKGELQVHMDRTATRQDISCFVEREIDRTPRLQDLRVEIQDNVSQKSDGMFLWARLMLDSLNDTYRLEDMKKRLITFPTELHAIYEEEMKKARALLQPEAFLLRQDVFHLLLQAAEPLTVDAISSALALNDQSNMLDDAKRFFDPLRDVEKLCRPFVTVDKDRQAHLTHSTVKEFLERMLELLPHTGTLKPPFSPADSNALLALKSLGTLSQERYRYWAFPAALLRKHLLAGAVIMESLQESGNYSAFYNYACRHWHEHVTHLKNPSEAVLEKLRRFLRGNELVTWSEVLFDLKRRPGLDPQLTVRVTLQKWVETLPPETQKRLSMEDFFVTPHESLGKDLEHLAEDKILQYLPLVRLGEFFNIAGQSREELQKAYKYERTVAEGYTALLGARNPITLRARVAMLKEYFWQIRYDEAEKDLSQIAGIQRDLFDAESYDLFYTLQFLGLAQFYLNKFSVAVRTLGDSEHGLKRLLGPQHPKTLITQLYKGYALEAQGDLDGAYKLYDAIWEQWTSLHGEEQALSLMVQCARGSILRKRRSFAHAEKMLLDCYRARTDRFTTENNVCIDTAIQLAVLYREMNQGKDAVDLLDSISASKVFSTDFERVCQVQHIRALVHFDAGRFEAPKSSLRSLLHQASGKGREKNNRELLWIRITLADVLRRHGEHDEALMLFVDLVEVDSDDDSSDDSSDDGEDSGKVVKVRYPRSLDDEPEAPDQLATAEKALRYLKNAQGDEAEELLRARGLRWVRKRDFWIMQGGPATDTASMSPVRLTEPPDKD